jgi:hypothetical protein
VGVNGTVGEGVIGVAVDVTAGFTVVVRVCVAVGRTGVAIAGAGVAVAVGSTAGAHALSRQAMTRQARISPRGK